MVLYTIYPPEVVMQSKEEEPGYLTLDIQGKTLVLRLVNGQAQIERIISTDPRDYLDPKWQPGTKVNLSLPFQNKF
jgi:hypothetical protein